MPTIQNSTSKIWEKLMINNRHQVNQTWRYFHLRTRHAQRGLSRIRLRVNKHYLINRWRSSSKAAQADFELDLPSFDVLQDQINDKYFKSLQTPFEQLHRVHPFFPAGFSLKKKNTLHYIASYLSWKDLFREDKPLRNEVALNIGFEWRQEGLSIQQTIPLSLH